MILETARLTLKPNSTDAFKAAFQAAKPLIEMTPGFQKIEVRPCIEHDNVYLLLVWWDTLEAHEVSFRQSAEYQEWKKLLHPFYDPFPSVEHFSESFLN